MIVTNNYMPGLSGAELIERVREDFPNLPILHVDDIARAIVMVLGNHDDGTGVYFTNAAVRTWLIEPSGSELLVSSVSVSSVRE